MKTITIRLSDDMHYKLKLLALNKSETLQNVILKQLVKLVPDAKLTDEEK